MSLTESLTQPLATVVVVMMASATAFARQTKQVDVYDQSFQEYYSCTGAEDEVRSILKQLGAEAIKTSCAGGLENQEGFVDVTAEFNVADDSDAGASWQTVQLKTDGGCDLDRQALAQILPAFTTRNVHLEDNCWAGDTHGVRATLTVWK